MDKFQAGKEAFEDKLVRLASICLILFSIFMVYVTALKEEEFMHAADEGQYFRYADIVSKEGLSQLPVLLQYYLSDTTEQLFPNPARIGHVLMTALWFKIFPNTYVSLAFFSLLCFVSLLAVFLYFSTKFFGRQIGWLSTLVLSCSPLLMSSGRRVLQDSNLNLFWGLTVWLFLDFLIDKRRLKFILFILVYSAAITIKESSLILLVFFICAFLLFKYKYKQSISTSYLWGIIILPFIFSGALYVFLLGGCSNVVSLVQFMLRTHFPGVITNSYSLYAMGPWYKYIIDYLILTPITTLLCIGYFLYVLFSRKFEWKIMYFMLYIVIVLTILGSMKYSKIVRFIAPLDMAVSLFSVLALYELFRHKRKDYQVYFVLGAVLGIFFINYQNFIELFCVKNIYDPISYLLLLCKGIIPY